MTKQRVAQLTEHRGESRSHGAEKSDCEATANCGGVLGLTPSSLTNFKDFQIRWKEPLGNPPYCYRWSFVAFGFSFRVYHWISQEVGPHFHNHPFDFVSFVVKGGYLNNYFTDDGQIKSVVVKAPSFWYSKAHVYHRLTIPKEGAWTLQLCSRSYVKWGFLVGGVHWRPFRYFSKFSHA
jgi:hypothetical protein